MTQPQSSGDDADSKNLRLQLWLRIGAVVLFAGVIVAAVATSGWMVCDDEVTQGGNVVKVCRHLQVTDPAVVAGAALLVVALAAFFSEVGAFGFSLKREVADARDAADSARAAAKSAKLAARTAAKVSLKAEEAAQYAQGAEESVAAAERLYTQVAASQQQPTTAAADVEEKIQELAAEYNTIRRSPKGDERTERMTGVVARMIALANGLAPRAVDVAPWLDSDDRGMRLAAYAFLHTHPFPALAPQLVQAAHKEEEEGKNFSQYWALRALRRQVSLDGEALDLNSRRLLERMLVRAGAWTDRGYELRQILSPERP